MTPSPWHDAAVTLPSGPGLYLCMCCFRPVAGDSSPPVLFPDIQNFLSNESPPRFS